MGNCGGILTVASSFENFNKFKLISVLGLKTYKLA
jgi:hypothetical protein